MMWWGRGVISLGVVCALSGAPVSAHAESNIVRLNADLVRLAKETRPGVVQVGLARDPGEEAPSEGPPPAPGERRRVGSGFVIDREGYILTNNHLFERPTEVEVEFFSGAKLPARIVGRDSRTDIALLKVDPPENLPVLRLGDSDVLEVGEIVVAVGNPFGLESAVTLGIVSRKGRAVGSSGPFEEYIQTDASINPGNSGGPLVNVRGEVVGINTAVIPRRGVGFAIPINLVKLLLPELKEKGKVTWGYLGITIQDVNKDLAEAFGYTGQTGAVVNSVLPGQPAAVAGIRRGDIIVAINGESVRTVRELQRLVGRTPVGTMVTVTIFRHGQTRDLSVRVEELPATRTVSLRPAPRKDLGLKVEALDAEKAKKYRLPDAEGVVVTEVAKGSPAAVSGLRPGDLVVELNHREIGTLEDFQSALAGSVDGGLDLFLIRRGEGLFYVSVREK